MAASREDMTPSEMWHLYLRAYEGLANLRRTMHPHREALEPSIGASLREGGSACAAALAYTRFLDHEGQIRLLPALVEVALTVSGETSEARRVIAELPRGEIVSFVAGRQSQTVLHGDYEEYACMLELWIELNRHHEAEALAALAAASRDEDVREIGTIYLEKLRKLGNAPCSR